MPFGQKAIDRSTSPRFARPSCQEGDFQNCTTSLLETLQILGVFSRAGLVLAGFNQMGSVVSYRAILVEGLSK